MDTSFSHIAVLVLSVDKSAEFLNSQNINTRSPEVFESEGTKEVYVGSYETQKGLLLLLEAISEGPYKQALIKRGPSLHHIAIDVLDIEAFVIKAQRLGWQLHPISKETMSYKTAWFFLKGIPTLIEVHQKKTLSTQPTKISKIELPLPKEQLPLFEGIGLGNIVFCGNELSFKVDGENLSFNQIACLK